MRIRIGDYRIIYLIDDRAGAATVYRLHTAARSTTAERPVGVDKPPADVNALACSLGRQKR
jgi:hypothetical protein